jgi:hypothetical protein
VTEKELEQLEDELGVAAAHLAHRCDRMRAVIAELEKMAPHAKQLITLRYLLASHTFGAVCLSRNAASYLHARMHPACAKEILSKRVLN